MKSDIGLIGLAVMGENLVLNIEKNGFSASVYNRSTEKWKILLMVEVKIKDFMEHVILVIFVNHYLHQEKLL